MSPRGLAGRRCSCRWSSEKTECSHCQGVVVAAVVVVAVAGLVGVGREYAILHEWFSERQNMQVIIAYIMPTK